MSKKCLLERGSLCLFYFIANLKRKRKKKKIFFNSSSDFLNPALIIPLVFFNRNTYSSVQTTTQLMIRQPKNKSSYPHKIQSSIRYVIRHFNRTQLTDFHRGRRGNLKAPGLDCCFRDKISPRLLPPISVNSACIASSRD